MRRVTGYTLFVCTLLFAFVFTYFLNLHHAEKQKELQNENAQLKYEVSQLRFQQQYKNGLQLNINQKNGFYTWPEREKVAETLVLASENKFKKEWALYLVKEANRYNIDPYLVFELLNVETGGTFNPEVIGPETKYGRAFGMAQFMKNTAPWIAEMAGLPYKEELLFDPYYSIQLSLVYLDYLENRYGNWDEALTAYHRGMSGLQIFIDQKGHAKSWYATEIQSNARQHKSVASMN